MSVYDKLRSFAEAREPDAAVIRDGLTYGDVRGLLAEMERLDAFMREECRWGCTWEWCRTCAKKKAAGTP